MKNNDKYLIDMPPPTISKRWKNSFLLPIYIKMNFMKKEKTHKLSNLLLENCTAYYWIGFLLADGHFSDDGVFKVKLSSIDKEHLYKLKEFISAEKIYSEEDGKYLLLRIMDKNIVSKIKKKFDISNSKTYNPPNLDFIKKESLLLSLIIGFVDGDGYIANKKSSFCLSVKCHSSWLSNLDMFAKKINVNSTAKINKAGYAVFSITNIQSLQDLKKQAIKYKLPILNRKWNYIDLTHFKNKKNEENKFLKFEKLFNHFKNFPYFEQKFNNLIYGK